MFANRRKSSAFNSSPHRSELRHRVYPGGLGPFALLIVAAELGIWSSAKACFHRGKPGGGVWLGICGSKLWRNIFPDLLGILLPFVEVAAER
jgi:hypothetical protein